MSKWISPIALLPIVAYFLGWTYLDVYYDRYEISISQLDLPLEHYFTTGVLALYRGWELCDFKDPVTWAYLSSALCLIASIAIWRVPIPQLAKLSACIAFILMATYTAYLVVGRVAVESSLFEPPLVVLEYVDHEQLLPERRHHLIYWDADTAVIGARNCPDMTPFLRRGVQSLTPIQAIEQIPPNGFIAQLDNIEWDVWILTRDKIASISFRKSRKERSGLSRVDNIEAIYVECVLRHFERTEQSKGKSLRTTSAPSPASSEESAAPARESSE